MKTHYKQLINPDFFGAYCIPEGQDLNIKILSVAAEECVVDKGKKEVLTVARLANQKPFILNATNSKSIAKLYGPYVEDWTGKTVTVYTTTTKLKGDDVECVRIRAQVAEKKPQKISDERLKEAIASIQAKQFTVDSLRRKFALTDEQQGQISAIFGVEHAAN